MANGRGSGNGHTMLVSAGRLLSFAAMDSALAQMDFETARAPYEWQVELGVDEAIGDDP